MKFSIVVPVYAPPMELFESAVESVRHQTYTDWEMILVDDGNTNRALKSRLTELERDEPRLHVISQPNQGPSAARNTGTLGATGDYLLYLDADDELPPYALENAAEILAERDVDLLIGFVQYLHSRVEGRAHRAVSASLLNPHEISVLYRDTLRGRTMPFGEDTSVRMKNGPVARVLRTEIAKAIPFPVDVPVSEDTVWNLRLFNAVESIGIVRSVWYWYRIDHASTSRGYREESFRETLALFGVLGNDLSSTRHDPSRDDVAARVLGEINRAMRLYYSHPNCGLGRAERAAQVRRLLRVPGMRVTLRDAYRAGTKPLIKYVLFRTGAGTLLPLKFYEATAASKSAAKPAKEESDR